MSVNLSSVPQLPAQFSWWALAVATGLALSACGGGGDAPTAAAEQPAAYTAGPITGFGSIIVNGVRFDDTAATVGDDDNASRTRSELKLGMMVEVDSGKVAGALGRAMHVRFHSAVLGPVEAVNASAGTLTVLGQAVKTTTGTVFGEGLSAGLSALTAGNVVNVHGQWDTTALAYTATRIELKAGATAYRVRGTIAGLDATAKTFSLGGAVIDYATAATPTTALANAQNVRVLLQTAPVNGRWVATSISNGAERLPDRADGHVRGAITAFTSGTSFTVGSTVVDARSATFPDGSAGVVMGARVEVAGGIVNGVLVATKVELDDRHAPDRHGFELHGAITSVNASAKTFVLRGITVNHGGTVVFERGSAAGLIVGAQVEVRGTRGADLTTLNATKIRFEN